MDPKLWGTLPLDVLHTHVLGHLVKARDGAGARGVCRAWRAAANSTRPPRGWHARRLDGKWPGGGPAAAAWLDWVVMRRPGLTRKIALARRPERILGIACAAGNLGLVGLYAGKWHFAVTKWLFQDAAANGQLAVVQSLAELRAPTRGERQDMFWRACRAGHLAVVKHFADKAGANPRWMLDRAGHLAATGGHLDVVVYLSRFCGPTSAGPAHALAEACSGGHLEMVAYLCETFARAAKLAPEYLPKASGHGHLDVVQYLNALPGGTAAERAAGLEKALRQAIRGGHLPAVKCLATEIQRRFPCGAEETLWRAVRAAVLFGQRGAAQYLLSCVGDTDCDMWKALRARASRLVRPRDV